MDTIFSKRHIYRDIMRLAWPAIAEQMLIMMVGMVSTIFVGRIGTEALAAVGMINMLVFFFQSIFAGLSTGSTVVIARITGEGDVNKAKTALIQSLFMGIITGVSVTLLGYVLSGPIICMSFGASEAKVVEIGVIYYKLMLIGLPFLVLDMVTAGAVRGAGDTKTPMVVTGIVNVINLVLSSVLIFGVSIKGYMLVPALGIKGAGISVTIARISGALMRILVLYLKDGAIKLSFKDEYRIDFEVISRIVKVGIPAFIEQLVMQGGFLVMTIMVVSMGAVPAAAWQVGVNVNSLAFMPIFGFSVATTTMVGQSLGSLNYDAAEMYARESKKMAIFIISCVGVLTFIFAKPLACLYTNDSEVVKLSMGIIRMFAFLEPFLAVMNVCSGVLRAAGDLVYVMVTSVVGLWIFRVMLSFILNFGFGLGIYSVMIGTSVDFIVRASMYDLRTRAGKWKYLKI